MGLAKIAAAGQVGANHLADCNLGGAQLIRAEIASPGGQLGDKTTKPFISYSGGVIVPINFSSWEYH